MCNAHRGQNIAPENQPHYISSFLVMIWSADTCSLTDIEDNPWWRLDLGYSTTIKQLFIAGPRSGPGPTDFEIRVGDSADNDTNKCGAKHRVRPGEIKTITCNLTGQYITIRVPENGRALSLCEVVVYGMGESLHKLIDISISSLIIYTKVSFMLIRKTQRIVPRRVPILHTRLYLNGRKFKIYV